MGIHAVLSDDGGQTWDVDQTVILRDDGGYLSELWDAKVEKIYKGVSHDKPVLDEGDSTEDPERSGRRPTSDVGYPHSAQLSDGSVLTVYYITGADRVTYIASTRWNP